MRMNRIIAGIVGTALLGLSPVALAPAAGAATVEATTTASTTSAAKGDTPRELNTKIDETRRGTFIRGRVAPDGAREKVVVKRKLGKKAPYRAFKVIKANSKGRFAFRVEFPRSTGPVWFYKVTVAGDATYARATEIFKACRGFC